MQTRDSFASPFCGKIQENRTSHVMVNLSAGRYSDSSGIASLVEALKASRDRGTRFILFGLSTHAREVLQLSRLIKVFDVALEQKGTVNCCRGVAR